MNTRQLALEALEDRAVMTGGFSATITDGALYCTVLAANQNLSFVSIDPSTVRVSTLLNGNVVDQQDIVSDTPFTSFSVRGTSGADTIDVSGIAGLSPVLVDGAEGNDSLTALSGSVTVKGGGGNDTITTGAGDDFVDGAEGNDSIQTGAGDDLVVGGSGADSIYGGSGDDLLFGGGVSDRTALLQAFQTWATNPVDRHSPIIAIQKAIPTDDGAVDQIDTGTGFDVSYNDLVRKVTLSRAASGAVWSVTDSATLVVAINSAKSGDTIQIAAGDYPYTPTGKKLAGVTIVGAGQGQTVIHGSLIIDNLNDQTPTVISNLTLDHSGLSHVSYYMGPAYNTFAQGTFYLDTVEVSGPGTDHAAAVYFWSSNTQKTRGYLTNCYLHDINDDNLSTWGGGTYTDSLVELYDITSVRAGSGPADQCVTAHNGMSVFVVGGFFSDAAKNVIAPDGKTTIDLYWATITPGTRNAGIEIPITWSVIDSCTIQTASMTVYGVLRNSQITQVQSYYPAFINVRDNALVQNNQITNAAAPYYPGAYTRPLRIAGNNATVIDNVFTNWNGLLLDIYGGATGSTVSGNTYQ